MNAPRSVLLSTFLGDVKFGWKQGWRSHVGESGKASYLTNWV